jgi:hypothetical protein
MLCLRDGERRKRKREKEKPLRFFGKYIKISD